MVFRRSITGGLAGVAVCILGVGACEGSGREYEPAADAGSAGDRGGGSGVGGKASGGFGGQASGFGGQASGFGGQASSFGGQASGFGGQASAFGGQASGFGGQGGELSEGGRGGTGGSAGAAGGKGPMGECTAGAKQCKGLQPQLCDSNGAWQSQGEPCSAVCAGGACVACASGTKRCDGLQPQTCDAGGTWQNTGSACPYICSQMTSACQGVCSPGGRQCSALQPQLCDANGAWQNMGSACPMVCNGGSCSACSPGAKQCNGLRPQLCDAAGTWQNSGNACPYVCSAGGTCTGSCVPGSKKCNGAQPQVCDANGAWQSSGSACGGCTSCSAMSGSCVVNTGAMCDDNNACTMGESCQSNGTCGGGTAKSCGGADQCHAVGSCVPATGCPAPVVKSGNCEDNNVCTQEDSCQSSGVCQGRMAPITLSCGNNKFCDGNGACKCRTKSSWNLLTNPGFDGSASSWTLSRSGYSTVDADSCSGSGSVLIPGQGSIQQCLPAKPNQTYYIGYRFKAARAATTGGTAHCYVAFLPAGNDCSIGDATSTFDADVDYTNTNWGNGFAGGTSGSNTTHLLFICSMVFDDVHYDQLSLSTTLPSAPGF